MGYFKQMSLYTAQALYFFINHGCLSVGSIDDKEEMNTMDLGFDGSTAAIFSGSLKIASII